MNNNTRAFLVLTISVFTGLGITAYLISSQKLKQTPITKPKTEVTSIVKMSGDTIIEEQFNDPEVKTTQKIAPEGNRVYTLRTVGWYHREIMYITELKGNFEQIKEWKVSEKIKSDKLLKSVNPKELQELQK